MDGNVGPQRKWTKAFVGLVLLVAIVGAAFALTNAMWGIFCAVLAVFEGWTLVNRYREDTISETIWEWAARPMIPCLFGIAFGWGAGSGYLGDPVTSGRNFAIGFLFGHFFFQRHAGVSRG
jgi:hypothetical protein